MNQNQVTTKRKAWWRRLLKNLVRAAVILFLLVLLVRCIWDYQSARSLRRELQAIRDKHQPLTFADLEAVAPKVDPQTDAARYYAAAMDLMFGQSKSGDKLTAIQQDLEDVDVAYAQAVRARPVTQPSEKAQEQMWRVLEYHRTALALADQGAACPTCQFNLGAAQGVEAQLERNARARQLGRLVYLRTESLLLAGQDDAAADSAITAVALPRITDAQPTLIAHLVQVAMYAQASAECQLVLEHGRPSEAALARMQEALLQTESMADLKSTFLAERIFGLATMRQVIQGNLDTGPMESATPVPEAWQSGWWGRPPLRSLVVGYLRDMAKMAEAAEAPWPDRVDRFQNEMAKKDSYSFLGRTTLPALGAAVNATGMSLAKARACRVAIMIERYRRAHGRVPDQLAELAPMYAAALPADPFTGKDLIYHYDADSYAVYSVGKDRKDDGGTEATLTAWDDVGVRIRLSKP